MPPKEITRAVHIFRIRRYHQKNWYQELENPEKRKRIESPWISATPAEEPFIRTCGSSLQQFHGLHVEELLQDFGREKNKNKERKASHEKGQNRGSFYILFYLKLTKWISNDIGSTPRYRKLLIYEHFSPKHQYAFKYSFSDSENVHSLNKCRVSVQKGSE